MGDQGFKIFLMTDGWFLIHINILFLKIMHNHESITPWLLRKCMMLWNYSFGIMSKSEASCVTLLTKPCQQALFKGWYCKHWVQWIIIHLNISKYNVKSKDMLKVLSWMFEKHYLFTDFIRTLIAKRELEPELQSSTQSFFTRCSSSHSTNTLTIINKSRTHCSFIEHCSSTARTISPKKV